MVVISANRSILTKCNSCTEMQISHIEMKTRSEYKFLAMTKIRTLISRSWIS